MGVFHIFKIVQMALNRGTHHTYSIYLEATNFGSNARRIELSINALKKQKKYD